MTRPRPLRSGDRIAIVAPASGCPREELDRGATEISRLGYEPVFTEAIFERGTKPVGPALFCSLETVTPGEGRSRERQQRFSAVTAAAER